MHLTTSPARTRRTRALFVAASLLAAGCSGSTDGAEPVAEVNPEASLQDAIASVGDWPGISLTVGLELDDQSVADIAGEADLAEADARLLTESSLTLTTAGTADDPGAGVEGALTVGETRALEFRSTDGGRVFVRVDLAVLEQLDEESDVGDGVDEFLDLGRMLSLENVVQAAIDGRWVELLDVDDAMQNAPGAGQDDGDAAGDEAAAERVSGILERFVDEDVTVTHVDDDGGHDGDRVRIETDGAALEELLDELAGTVEDDWLLGGGLRQDPGDADIDEDLTVSLDVWIVDGELVRIAVDLAALSDGEMSGQALLVAELEQFNGSITAPDDAEPLDLSEVMGGMMGGFSSSSADAGAGATDPSVHAPPAPPAEGEELPTECISEAELDELAEFAGPEPADELRDLLDSELLELC